MRLGETQARAIFATWPNSTTLVAKLRQLLPGTTGPILDDNNRAVAEYYLPNEGDEWYRWSTGSSLRLPDGKSLNVPVSETLDPTTYVDRIRGGYFSVVILTVIHPWYSITILSPPWPPIIIIALWHRSRMAGMTAKYGNMSRRKFPGRYLVPGQQNLVATGERAYTPGPPKADPGNHNRRRRLHWYRNSAFHDNSQACLASRKSEP